MSATKRQREYAKARFGGAGITEAAIAAGCPEKSAAQAGSRLEKHPKVVALLDQLKAAESENNPAAGRDNIRENRPTDDPYFEDPRDFLLYRMNDTKLEMKDRVSVALGLMPYEHQKRGESGKKEQKQQSAQAATSGRFSSAKPPQLSLIQKH